MMKSEKTRSWLERARVDGASQPKTGRDVRTAASALQRDLRGGRDPLRCGCTGFGGRESGGTEREK